MPYDFDKSVDRRNTHSLKWNVKENELPMWVADMDFQMAPEILAVIQKRAAHGVFGYSIVPEGWYQAYTGWWGRRHGFSMEKDWLIFCTGVVPAISSMVRKLTTVGENVLIQTPVYNIFFNSIVNNGRNVVESPLRYDGNTWQMDFEDLERKLSDPQTTLMLLCNPHNPVGRIWSREELGQAGELCRKYHVTVISDEIHCDLTAPGQEYVPFASVSESCRNNSITCIAPTKAFNLAGLKTAAVAAFTEGEAWLDCRDMQGCAMEFTQYLREHTGLYLSEGRQYGESGSSFIRMNIACPKSRLEDGLKRLVEGARGYEAGY